MENWVPVELITSSRLDNDYYLPEAITAIKKIRSNSCWESYKLNEVCTDIFNFGAYEQCNLLKFFPLDHDLVPFINISDIDQPFIKLESAKYITKKVHSELKKSQCKPFDVLLSMAGTIGKIGLIPQKLSDCNSNQALAKLRLNKDIVNPYYVVAFLISSFGQLQCEREAAGAVQKNLYLYNIGTIEIALPSKDIQHVIGNKIRKAERLYEICKATKDDLSKLLNEGLKWRKSEHEMPNLSSWLSVAEIDHRLDGKYNTPKRLGIIRHLKKQNIQYSKLCNLLEVSAMIGWKGLTTDHYRSEGPYLIRGVDFDNGMLFENKIVCVDYEKYVEQPQIHLKPGDIVMTKDGTIGKALTIPNLGHKMCAGSTVARLRNKTDIPPHYFEAIINHAIIQSQIESFATGLAQPHITQEWIAELLIPIIPSYKEVATAAERHNNILLNAKNTIEEAKCDIENLIKGTHNCESLLSKSNELERWIEENPSPNN